jgi:hypothetical protein
LDNRTTRLATPGNFAPAAVSASPHYQSRLFNFLTDRALRWGDRAAQALRHAQIAAATVARSVLLPLWAIAENLGIHPPQLPGFGRSVTDRSVFAPGVDDDYDPDQAGLDVDAPIRATLTILEAVGWPTVDRLDREALQPTDRNPLGQSEQSHQSAQSNSTNQTHQTRQLAPLRWLARFKRPARSSHHPDLSAPPEPLALQLSERELRAIAPQGKQTHTPPIRGLASELGRNDLVLISAHNEIVAHLGVFPQQTLDRDVRILLNQLAPASLPPAPSGLAALPPEIGQLVQPWLTRLDAGLARFETRSLPPAGFAIAQPFDLHHEFAEAALETAIATPLQQLQTSPASNLKALESDLTASLQSLARSLLPAAIAESPTAPGVHLLPQHPLDLHRDLGQTLGQRLGLTLPLQAFNSWAIALRPPADAASGDHDHVSHTTIEGSHWLIDPADPWWRNAIDLARAAIVSTVSAIVPIKSSPPEPDPVQNSPDLADWIAHREHGDRALHSKTANRLRDLRDWLRDRADSADTCDAVTAPIVTTAHDGQLHTKSTPPETVAPSTTQAITQPATSANVTARSQPQSTASGLEFDPDWIEAEVKQSRYVMHPLERVLRWLDRAMVTIEGWIERAIAAIAQWWSRQRAS